MAAISPYALCVAGVAGYGALKIAANRLFGGNDKPVDVHEAAEKVKRCQEKIAPIKEAVVEGCNAIKTVEAELAEESRVLLELQTRFDEKQKSLDGLKEAVVYLSGVDTNNSYKLWWNRDGIEKAQRVIGRFVGQEQMRRTFSGVSESSAPKLPFSHIRDMSLPTRPKKLTGGLNEHIQGLIQDNPFDPYMQGSVDAQAKAVVDFLQYCRYNSMGCERTVWKKSEPNKMTLLQAALKKYPEAEREAITKHIFLTNPGFLPMTEQQKIQQQMMLSAQQAQKISG